LELFFVVSPPPSKIPVKLSCFRSAGAEENSLLKSVVGWGLDGCSSLGRGTLNSLVNAPGSFSAGAADAGVAGIEGAALNIAVNSPGGAFGAGSGGLELSFSGKLKIFANSSGEAESEAGRSFTGGGGCAGACALDAVETPKS
jgi:hypothetical protein